MKCLVETVGPVYLTDFNGDEYHHDRPSVVSKSSFLDQNIARGQVKLCVAEELPGHATDAEWLKCYQAAEGDFELAVASFKAILSGDVEDEQATAEAAKKAQEEADAAAAAEAAKKAKEEADAAAAAEAAKKAKEEADAAAAAEAAKKTQEEADAAAAAEAAKKAQEEADAGANKGKK
jgi:hypothetical protein